MIVAILITAALTSAVWYFIMRLGEVLILHATYNHMEENGCPTPSNEELQAGIREAGEELKLQWMGRKP